MLGISESLFLEEFSSCDQVVETVLPPFSYSSLVPLVSLFAASSDTYEGVETLEMLQEQQFWLLEERFENVTESSVDIDHG